MKTKKFWKEFTPIGWSLRKGYSLSFFKNDCIAGITVGMVALPLAMAFAIASGVAPEKGLYTAIIAGFIISFFGGSRYQIGGPTGAFVIIIYDIVKRSGYEGLVIAAFIAGIILLIAAFSRLGALMKYVPYPLIIGFTSGIAVIIFSSQVTDFLGLSITNLPPSFIAKWSAIFSALPSLHIPTFALALGTLALIVIIKRWAPMIPWGITAVAIATVIAWGWDLPVETIKLRFGEIHSSFPMPSFPRLGIAFSELQLLIPDAITIAFLAGIESLLSAVVADGMAGSRHKSNCELMAQGIANMGSVIFGGIPATGAIARTATNIKSGAKTPLAGMIHSITLLLILLLLAPVVSQIPLAALSAVLVMVAWNMSEVHTFCHLFKAPTHDILILLTTFLLTVFVDLTVAVEVGMILAAFLFMKKIRDSSGVVSLPKESNGEDLPDRDAIEKKEIPVGVEVYEIQGAFFFGVADTLKDILSNLEYPPKVFIMRMRRVSMIDASGMYALSDFFNKCKKENTALLLSEVGPSLLTSLKKFGLFDLIGEKHIFSRLDAALKYASASTKGK